jgi:hypothetical protein
MLRSFEEARGGLLEMKAIGIFAAAVASLALASCDQLGIGAAGNASNEVAGNEATGNVLGGKPADAAGNQAVADPGAGLDGKDPGATQAASAGNAPLDRAYMMGRWTDDGDCGNAVDFLPDGRLLASNGREGLWNLAGDRLTMTVDQTITLQVVPIDQNTMNVVNPDGSLGRSTRC